jgi:hypothetical protein
MERQRKSNWLPAGLVNLKNKKVQTTSISHFLGPLRLEHTGSRKTIQTWQSEPSTIQAGKYFAAVVTFSNPSAQVKRTDKP